MKKVLSVLVLAVFMASTAFAAVTNMTPAATKPADSVKSSVDVALDIKVSDMYSYAFGFSGALDQAALEDASLASIPTTTVDVDGTLDLVFDKDSSTASNSGKDLYMFYKIQAPAEAITLKITPSYLQDDNGAANVGMTVSNSSETGALRNGNEDNLTFSATSAAPDTISLTPKAAGKVMYGSIKLNIVTDVIPPLAKNAAFKGSIELNIAAN